MGKEMFEPLDDEKVKKIYELLDENETVRGIAEKLEIAPSTVQKYRNEWKEERDIERRVKEKKFGVEEFENALNKLPGLGKKTVEFIMDVVELDPDQIKDPTQIYKLITKEGGVKGDLAETFVRGLVRRYDLVKDGRGEHSPPYFPTWPGHRTTDDGERHPPTQIPPYGRTQTDGNMPQYDRYAPPPPYWDGQRSIYPPQPEPKEEKMITIETPLRDKDGKVERDEDGDILYMRKTVPESKAGIYEEKREEKKESDHFVESIKLLGELGLLKKGDDNDDRKTSNIERHIDRLAAEVKSMRRNPPREDRREEKEERLTKDEVRRLMMEDRAEVLRALEDQKKDDKLTFLQSKLEEVLEDKSTHDLAKLPDDVRGAKIDMETQESTANIINQGLETVTNKLDKAVERIITFNKQSENQQVEVYRNTINNLMARGLSREKAVQGARELLYSTPPVARPASHPQQQQAQQQPEAQDEDELVEEMKRRAMRGDGRR